MSIPQYLIESPVTIPQLAQKLVDVGEGFNMMQQLSRRLDKSAPLEITLDASEVQPIIDKIINAVDIYCEIIKIEVSSTNPLAVQLDAAARIAWHTQYSNVGKYRVALLNMAALTVAAIKEIDREQDR